MKSMKLARKATCAFGVVPMTSALALVISLNLSAQNQNWPQWRGPTGNGTAEGAKPPTTWSQTENLAWKTEIPGEGHSSPVVWGDRVFVMTAVPGEAPDNPPEPGGRRNAGAPDRRPDGPPPGAERGQGPGRGGRFGPPGGGRFGGGDPVSTAPMKFMTLCLDRRTGKILWEKTGHVSPPVEGRHRTNTYCSGSPVTDGSVVISNFSSYGIYCYDMDGNVMWEKDLGDMRTRNGFGEGSSPALHGDTVFILWDTEDESWLYALDKNTGEQKWKKARDEKTGWTTPYVLTHNGVTQVVVNASNKVRSYRVDDGSLLWECSGQTTNAIPSVVYDGDVVYAMSGYRGNTAMAISLGGEGDISGSDKILWTLNRGTPYVPSPLLYDGYIYFCKGNDAFFSCVDTKNGKVEYGEERLPDISGVYSSPVGADGKVYLCGQNGITMVIKAGKNLEILASNDIGEPINASPAIVGDSLLIRGNKHLFCISNK